VFFFPLQKKVFFFPVSDYDNWIQYWFSILWQWAQCHTVVAMPLLIAFELLLCIYLESLYGTFLLCAFLLSKWLRSFNYLNQFNYFSWLCMVFNFQRNIKLVLFVNLVRYFFWQIHLVRLMLTNFYYRLVNILQYLCDC
jgi:hypothetical protein